MRLPRSRRRRLVQVLGVLALAAAAVFGMRAGLEQYARRQITGALTTAPGMPASALFQAGLFELRWSNGQLSVRHQDAPETVLWASLPRQSFVAAAQGRETVDESRGLFFFEDRLQRVCDRQRVDQMGGDGRQVSVSGVLFCSSAQSTRYTLVFAAVAPDQLQFTLTLDDPTLNRTYLTYASDPEERFFGFGEQFSFFDIKGRRLPIWSSEQGVGRGAQPVTAAADLQYRAGGNWASSYLGVPHYLTSRMRSLCLESYAYVVFDLRRRDRVHIQLWAPSLTGRILYGDSPSALIQSYTSVAGRMRPLPGWVHTGAIVAIQGGSARVREVLQQLQAHETPVAAVWLQDWVGQRTTPLGRQLWWNWEVDRERYPDWEALVAELHAANIRVLTYINPMVVDVGSKPGVQRNLFAEAQAAGYLVRNAAGETAQVQNSNFLAGLIDLTNPAARAWLKEVIRTQLLGSGVDGWMADYGEALPYDALLFSGETGASYHNRYPEEWARLNREVLEECGRGDELLFFMRAGYRHSPGLATLFWTGDQLPTWDAQDGIKTAVIAMLSSGMSGFSLNHSDIGGFTTLSSPIRNYHRDRELLLRWAELAAFTPVFRTHEGSRPDVNVQVYTDDETRAHFSRMARVYVAWADYRRALVQEAAATGLPVVRHLCIHYPDDPEVYRISYQQYMLGSELLVAPVLDPGRTSVPVYLPRGRWVHVWSGQTYGDDTRGVMVTVDAPPGQPAVFYRAGSTAGERFVERLAALGVLP